MNCVPLDSEIKRFFEKNLANSNTCNILFIRNYLNSNPMQRFILRIAAIVALVFCTQFVHAQMTIIEYFDVKSDFSLDLTNKKNVKNIFTKGVLDVEWNPDKRILAVAYDPKAADINVIVKNINDCAGKPLLSVVNTKLTVH